MEFLNDTLERIIHSEGRLLIDQDDGDTHLQYRIGDHLNNTVVLFEDKNSDGILIDPDEILVKKLYYLPKQVRDKLFGMELEGVIPDSTSPNARYLYNNKEYSENGGVLFYGARLGVPMIGRFAGVDPISDQFAHVSVYNYAENEPVGHIDLWGLQKYWSTGGAYLGQINGDNSMRVVPHGTSLSNLDGVKQWEAQRLTEYNENKILGDWAGKYQNTGRAEKTMSTFTKYVESDDGVGFSPLVVEGSTGTGEEQESGGKVDPLLSNGPIGWRRSTVTHTHPASSSYKSFSNINLHKYTVLESQGDIQFAVDNNVKMGMVPNYGRYWGLFDPKDYTNFVRRQMVSANKMFGHKMAAPNRMRNEGGTFWIEPDSERDAVKGLIQ